MTCGECIYFVDFFCRRYPPTITVVHDPDDGFTPCVGFPTVEKDEWCGEFKSDKNH